MPTATAADHRSAVADRLLACPPAPRRYVEGEYKHGTCGGQLDSGPPGAEAGCRRRAHRRAFIDGDGRCRCAHAAASRAQQWGAEWPPAPRRSAHGSRTPRPPRRATPLCGGSGHVDFVFAVVHGSNGVAPRLASRRAACVCDRRVPGTTLAKTVVGCPPLLVENCKAGGSCGAPLGFPRGACGAHPRARSDAVVRCVRPRSPQGAFQQFAMEER